MRWWIVKTKYNSSVKDFTWFCIRIFYFCSVSISKTSIKDNQEIYTSCCIDYTIISTYCNITCFRILVLVTYCLG